MCHFHLEYLDSPALAALTFALSEPVQLHFTQILEASDGFSHSSFVLNLSATTLSRSCPAMVVPGHG